MKKLLIAALKFYRKCLSPLMLAKCRFYPSCSAYAIESLQRKGLLRGVVYSVKRLLRCHPFSAGGYDPVK